MVSAEAPKKEYRVLTLTRSRRILAFLPMAFVLAIIASACEVEAEEIRFGKDQCHSCRMAIVDRQHAAQFVTAKGKQYMFDSIECMNDSVSNGDYGKIAILKVAEFGQQHMIDAESAFFLVSKEIRSPMGANLSAFDSQLSAEQARKKHGGAIYRWSELDAYLRALPARGLAGQEEAHAHESTP